MRADMTTQVARIAATQIRRRAPAFAFELYREVLRIRGSQLRPERQFAQVGAELIEQKVPQLILRSLKLLLNRCEK